MMLRHQDDGSFVWHDIPKEIPPTTITFFATPENLAKTSSLPGFQNPTSPEGRDPNKELGCPKLQK